MRKRVMFAVTMVLLAACGTPPAPIAARTQQAEQFGTLDQLLAPIALYPDPLLAQMLLSASDPAKVVELDQWLKNNTTLKATQLQDAAVKAGFDASFVALALFPQVVSTMATRREWTTLLGQAFTADRNAVFASIQKLRHQAQDVGTLKTTPQQEVTTKKTSAGEEVIVIEPANPQIVYVPQYNTQVVYTQAPTQTVAPTTVTNTIIVQEDNTDEAIAAGVIGFTAGVAIGAAMNNSYYYGPYGWHGGGYMYNDAWDDYYDHREDARDDWQDHREDVMEDRGDRREDVADQRGDRSGTRQEQRTERQGTTQQQRTDRQQTRQESGTAAAGQQTQQRTQQAQQQRAQTQSATAQSGRTGSTSARGYGDSSSSRAQPRSGGSDAFSGYSSGSSQRSSSSRGQASRSSSRGGGGGGRRR
jgi:hypothetical protein